MPIRCFVIATGYVYSNPSWKHLQQDFKGCNINEVTASSLTPKVGKLMAGDLEEAIILHSSGVQVGSRIPLYPLCEKFQGRLEASKRFRV